jgi:GT2 family glycosyltransferase
MELMSSPEFDLSRSAPVKSGSQLAIEPGTVQVQCIAYELNKDAARRTVEYVDTALGHAVKKGLLRGGSLVIGDCSSKPIFDAVAVRDLNADLKSLGRVSVEFFNENLGHGGGQNRLLATTSSELTLVLNPDVVVAPDIFLEMVPVVRRPTAGLVEARQMPSEHAKSFDPVTGKTSWGSGACLLAHTKLLRDLGGFDAETFFLYCDDVDLSWRARLAGHDVVYQPTAVCFHDKRLSDDGGWMAGGAERYYSAEAGLLLPYKYSRSDLTERYLASHRKSKDPVLMKAAAAFDERKAAGRLPRQIDPDHKVAQFINGNYAEHRFKPR